MISMINTIPHCREKLERTASLEEAIHLLFGQVMQGRLGLLSQEIMTGEVAEAYMQLGKKNRRQTYEAIAEDFMTRVQYDNKDNKNKIILDAGCGPGLLLHAFEEKIQRANTHLVGIDASPDMVRYARTQILPSSEVREGSIYALGNIVRDYLPLSSIACRNVLHRLQNPKEAIQQMYDTLEPRGKLYIRDLRRDADWKTVLARIGEERWQQPALVQDYVAAMAAMITTTELENMLCSLGIYSYTITDGDYVSEQIANGEGRKTKRKEKIRNEWKQRERFNEYAKEVEYVCVIEKQ